MDIEDIRERGREGKIVLTRHAAEECTKDRISGRELSEAIVSAELVEDYPTDARGPSCLVLGCAGDGRPIHVVLGTLDGPALTVITAYRPDLQPHRWSGDFRERRR